MGVLHQAGVISRAHGTWLFYGVEQLNTGPVRWNAQHNLLLASVYARQSNPNLPYIKAWTVLPNLVA